jgi:DNA repair protein RadA/Sms
MNDVYATVAGGLKISEPSVDFAAAVSMASSLLDRPILGRYCFVGEVGLSGEIRACPHLGIRIAEAAKMGFERIYIPEASLKSDAQRSSASNKNIEIVPVRSLSNFEKLGIW